HELSQSGRCHEALAAADAYTAIACAVGDEKTVTYLYQGRMYAYEGLGQFAEAIAAGEDPVRPRRAVPGDRPGRGGDDLPRQGRTAARPGTAARRHLRLGTRLVRGR